MESREEVLNYLRQKYNKYRTGNIEVFESFDPWMDPDQEHIPPCSSCQKAYEEYKIVCGPKCTIEHSSACLWFDFFAVRIKRLNRKVQFVRKS